MQCVLWVQPCFVIWTEIKKLGGMQRNALYRKNMIARNYTEPVNPKEHFEVLPREVRPIVIRRSTWLAV